MSDPDTIHGAVKVVKDALTAEGAAQVIGKTDQLIYKFTKADARPNIDQCMALDIAYEAKTGLPGPIMRAARNKVAAAKTGDQEARCLNEDILSLVDELGSFARTTQAAWADKVISPLEKAELKSGLFRLEMVAHAARENIEAHTATDEPRQVEPTGQIELAIH